MKEKDCHPGGLTPRRCHSSWELKSEEGVPGRKRKYSQLRKQQCKCLGAEQNTLYHTFRALKEVPRAAGHVQLRTERGQGPGDPGLCSLLRNLDFILE